MKPGIETENTSLSFTSTLTRKLLPNILYGILGTTIFILLWKFLGIALFKNPGYEQFKSFLPEPAFKALWHLSFENHFWGSVLASLKRIFTGIFIAFIIGFPTGLFLGSYAKLRITSYLPLQFLRMISPLSWMPIALLIFSTFESAICFLVTIATIWPVIINTTSSVLNVDRQWIIMARDQGARDYHLIFKVIIPAIIPSAVISLRLALGIAWIVLVPAEFLGVSSGLGYLINDARDTMEYDRLMAIIIAIGIIGFLLDGTIHIMENNFLSRRYVIRNFIKKTRLNFLPRLLFIGLKTLYFWVFMDICFISILYISSHPVTKLPSGFFLPHIYGIFVGTMVMFTGLGAGVLWFPFLTHLGFTPIEIVPISIFNQITGKGSGSFKYFNDDMLEKKVIRHFIPYSLLGVFTGFLISFFMPSKYEKWLYIIFIIVVFYLIAKIIKHGSEENRLSENTRINMASLKKSGLIVFISSIFTGLLSIGNSDWLIPYMKDRLNMPSTRAVATGIFVMFIAVLFYLFLTVICVALNITEKPHNLIILFATCSGVILGGQIGSRLIHIEFLKRHQKNAFIIMMVLSALHITWEFLIVH